MSENKRDMARDNYRNRIDIGKNEKDDSEVKIIGIQKRCKRCKEVGSRTWLRLGYDRLYKNTGLKYSFDQRPARCIVRSLFSIC